MFCSFTNYNSIRLLMEIKTLVDRLFKAWDDGDYMSIPVSDDFSHTSPYGTVEGNDAYLAIVMDNADKFLGNRIDIHDSIYDGLKACVRYTITNKAFTVDVSEWIYSNGELINRIISYYNVEGEIGENRKLSGLK